MRRTLILLLVNIFCFFNLNLANAKTEYEIFYFDYPISDVTSIKIKYEIKISKIKKPTKNKCSKVTVKVKRLNAQELNTQLTQDEKWRIRNSLVITLISADFYDSKNDGLMRRTSFVPEWEGLNAKTSTLTRCLSHKWDTSGMKAPMSIVLDGVLVPDIKISFIK